MEREEITRHQLAPFQLLHANHAKKSLFALLFAPVNFAKLLNWGNSHWFFHLKNEKEGVLVCRPGKATKANSVGLKLVGQRLECNALLAQVPQFAKSTPFGVRVCHAYCSIRFFRRLESDLLKKFRASDFLQKIDPAAWVGELPANGWWRLWTTILALSSCETVIFLDFP
jgi:hypothetical protein